MTYRQVKKKKLSGQYVSMPHYLQACRYVYVIIYTYIYIKSDIYIYIYIKSGMCTSGLSLCKMGVYLHSLYFCFRCISEDITNVKSPSRKKLTYNRGPKLQELLSQKY